MKKTRAIELISSGLRNLITRIGNTEPSKHNQIKINCFEKYGRTFYYRCVFQYVLKNIDHPIIVGKKINLVIVATNSFLCLFIQRFLYLMSP